MPSKKVEVPKFTVIRDTREKENKGWVFNPTETCTGMVDQALDTGDYSLVGMEDLLCIERKGSVAELANNVTESRWPKFLARMERYEYKFLILDFSWESIIEFPMNSGIPLDKLKSIRISGKFLMRLLSEIQVNRGIHVLPCNDPITARYVASNIMKRVNEQHHSR